MCQLSAPVAIQILAAILAMRCRNVDTLLKSGSRAARGMCQEQIPKTPVHFLIQHPPDF